MAENDRVEWLVGRVDLLVLITAALWMAIYAGLDAWWGTTNGGGYGMLWGFACSAAILESGWRRLPTFIALVVAGYLAFALVAAAWAVLP